MRSSAQYTRNARRSEGRTDGLINMTNRSTRVGLGLAIAVVLAIVWALSRFDATSVEHLRSADVERSKPSPVTAVLEAPTREESEGEDTAEAQAMTEAAIDSKPEAGSAPLREITLHGAVTDARGGPLRLDELLSGAESDSEPSHPGIVWLRRSSGRRGSTRIDHRGQYSFAGLRPGTWNLLVEVAGYRERKDTLVVLGTDSDRQLDFTLEPCDVLHVRVEVELDEPLTDHWQFQSLVRDNDCHSTVHVVVTKSGQLGTIPDGDEYEIARGLTGRVRTKEECAGPKTWVLRESIELHTELPVYAGLAVGNRVLQQKRVLSTDEEVVFTFTLAQLRSSLGGVWFRIVDEQGRSPEVPCAVELTRSSGEVGSWPYLELERMVESASNSIPNTGVDFDAGSIQGARAISNPGEIRLRGLHPGPIGIEVSLPGHASLQLETVVDSGVDRFLGEFRLVRSLGIRGRVLNPNGTPADADVEYIAVGDAVDGASIFHPETRVTDSLGHFAIYDAGPGRFRLRGISHVDPTWASMPMILGAQASAALDGIVIQLSKRTQVTVKLAKPPSGGILMRIEDASGLLVEKQSAGVTERGAYAGFDLVPGQYTARALSHGQEVANLGFSVGEAPLRLTLNPR